MFVRSKGPGRGCCGQRDREARRTTDEDEGVEVGGGGELEAELKVGDGWLAGHGMEGPVRCAAMGRNTTDAASHRYADAVPAGGVHVESGF